MRDRFRIDTMVEQGLRGYRDAIAARGIVAS